MKEFYVSPEVEVTCFAPVEGIATANNGWEVSLTSTEESTKFETVMPNDPEFNGEIL